MLDGLLGRSGFYSKCKSLIKQTRTRIEVVRRKRNATQKFLRTDIADLLSNGLDSNAFSRADGLISDLILSSCYEFIDHVCEIILKHLPVLQKLRDCPEDCREAVASLMFAAARFSDLPELRDLRDLFQGRYGSSLEYFVNPKLVDNITPTPASEEKKIQLLQDIAVEFSIRWDSRGFQERMSSTGAEKKQWQSPGTLHAAKQKVETQPAEVYAQKMAKDEALMKKRNDSIYQKKEKEVDGRHQTATGWDSVRARKDDLKYDYRKLESASDKSKSAYREESAQKQEKHDIPFQKRENKAEAYDFQKTIMKEAVQVGSSSHGRRLESVDSQHRRQRHNLMPDTESPRILSPPKLNPQPVQHGIKSPSRVNDVLADDNHVRSMRKRQDENGMKSPSRVNDVLADDKHLRSMRKRQDENGIRSPSPVSDVLSEDVDMKSTRRQDHVTDGLKSNFRGGLPPPYSKPRRNRRKTDDVDGQATENDTLTFRPASNGNRAENLPTKADSPDIRGGESAPENGDGPVGFTKIYYKEESGVEFTPRRRSHRRRHSRSSSKDENSDERVVRRVSTSRRKHESRKGLQILVDDDELPNKDEEEKIIDKLLLHYSKKPTADPSKSRRRTKTELKDQKAADGAEDEESTPTTSRSYSLPSRQVTEPKPEKIFTRAASFQPDTPAKHVHPKLPDYDDLAARFAALRATKG